MTVPRQCARHGFGPNHAAPVPKNKTPEQGIVRKVLYVAGSNVSAGHQANGSVTSFASSALRRKRGARAPWRRGLRR
ncbi:hypothetical protein AGR2A_pc0138 [Agrobacterium genomosp. 2 str. CFBP 5494]|uniref:Uncharacterized protein n=1 Tax=Agrobacterium genomosp. 2 str. CFBP 5494 TaxID=1183436 RepID=A0A9W5B895_9HYPH|nr:hypothetical protein AGR2A_pc0138 [Agrobacterium genomosp. 2 str. CFBP 5494]